MDTKTQWFTDARFGMFIHWGLYSILERGEWVQEWEMIPADEYAQLAKSFKPKKFNADHWVRIAKAAGMKYMVLTTKHHDGFCLYDSKLSSYTSVKTAAKRDFIKEYADACHRAGMKLGFYFSILDWSKPACMKAYLENSKLPDDFVAYAHGQIKELMTNYGKVDLLWFDGGMNDQWDAKKTVEMIYQAQPHILVNDRIGNEPHATRRDFSTPERVIPGGGMAEGRVWESCLTMNDNWGIMAGDENWKSTTQLIYDMVRCASGSGNCLLNVGPDADGTIPAPAVKRLKEMGKWLAKNDEAIRGTVKCPVTRHVVSSLCTQKGKKIYVNVYFWSGKEIPIAAFTHKIKRAYILSTGKKVKTRLNGDRLFIHGLPKKAPDKHVSVIVLEIE